jgi:mono/diheme cytochrome c family protein
MKRILPVVVVVAGGLVAAIFARGESAPLAVKPVMPPAVNRPVDFVKDVVPIFQQSCVNCHSSGKSESDFSIETREKLIEGGGSGSPGMEPGKSAESTIIQLVSGLDPDPDRFMPKKGKKLTQEQIGILRAWIDQGAAWPKGYELHDASRPIPAKLEPRQVAIPAAHDGISNPIDLLLEPYFAKHDVKPTKVIDDRAFVRRIYLDLVGVLPSSDEVEKFVGDPDSGKRQALVRKLLDDKPRYAVHWLSFWNDLLRNDYKGTGYIDGGRLPITPWLYHALLDDMPYDQFVRELVTGANGSEGFTKGIVWRGVVNAAQTPQMQAAQNIGQVFMGVNLKCASCHDSFISQWKLTDSYGLAGVYADKPLEMERLQQAAGADGFDEVPVPAARHDRPEGAAREAFGAARAGHHQRAKRPAEPHDGQPDLAAADGPRDRRAGRRDGQTRPGTRICSMRWRGSSRTTTSSI